MADCAWVSVHASLGWPDDTTKQIDGGTLLSALALGVAELLVMGSFCSCFTRSQRKYASIIMRIAPKLMALTMAMLAPESLQRLLGCVTGAVPVLGKYNGLLTLALTWGAVAYQVPFPWHGLVSALEWLLLSCTWYLQSGAPPAALSDALLQLTVAAATTSAVAAICGFLLMHLTRCVSYKQAVALADAKTRTLSVVIQQWQVDAAAHNATVASTCSSSDSASTATPAAGSSAPGRVNGYLRAATSSQHTTMSAAAVAPVAVVAAPAGPLSLLADVTASLALLRTGNTAEVLPDTATKREAALQRLEDVLGSDFAARLRVITAARQPFQHLSYTPLCAFEPVGVKVSSSRRLQAHLLQAAEFLFCLCWQPASHSNT
eukprot:jgi/Chrzof1/3514/Cz12g28080.t1